MGKAELQFIETSMDARAYKALLSRSLLPFRTNIHNEDYIFQQDNAACHASEATLDWLERKGVNYMDWPSCSPDLNPIENLWGEMARQVYADGKQYFNLEQLKAKIIEVWNGIPLEYLKSLSGSMSNRMFEVAKAQGGSINY